MSLHRRNRLLHQSVPINVLFGVAKSCLHNIPVIPPFVGRENTISMPAKVNLSVLSPGPAAVASID